MTPLAWRDGGAVEIVIGAEAAQVYELVADVARIGERSPECHRASWLDPGTAGQVGARFRGDNRVGLLARWSRTCEVDVADPGREFTFHTVPQRDPSRRDSTSWSYRLEADPGGGTRVVHSYRIELKPLLPFRALYSVLLPDHRDMRPQMLHNLQELKRQLEDASESV